MDYEDALAIQYATRDAVQGGGESTVLVVEHPAVATLGRRGTPDEVFDPSLPVVQIERGGKATLHAPGQLVIYPIVHIGVGNRDVRAWVRHLEQFVHDLLAHFDIASHTKVEYPGVWTDATDKKIASIGIALQQWVSIHGIAVNVTLEPNEFERIDPGGLGAAVMTNMAREGAKASMEDVRAWVIAHAADHFAAFQPSAKDPHITQ